MWNLEKKLVQNELHVRVVTDLEGERKRKGLLHMQSCIVSEFQCFKTVQFYFILTHSILSSIKYTQYMKFIWLSIFVTKSHYDREKNGLDRDMKIALTLMLSKHGMLHRCNSKDRK